MALFREEQMENMWGCNCELIDEFLTEATSFKIDFFRFIMLLFLYSLLLYLLEYQAE